MPEGIAVEIDNGFATIAPDAAHRNEVLTALLSTTPAELIEKQTRSGPGVQYRVPEGNARAAGLVDDLGGAPTDRKDMGFADALVAADPNAHDEGHWHNPQITVSGNAYVNGRDGANGAIRGPLRPNKPVAEAPARPEGATLSAAELQAHVNANTPFPADYAPDRHTPTGQRSPSGQATIATVISGAADAVSGAITEAVQLSQVNYDDGQPDADWSRKALDDFARGIGLDPGEFKNKQAVLDAIRAAQA